MDQEFPTFDYSQASAYFQDELNISNNFKLTAGLRLEMPWLSNPNNNFNKDFADVAAANPNSSFAGLSTDDLPDLKVNFSPRIGVNWDIKEDRSLILRGGTGFFTGRIPFVWLVSAMGNANVLQYQYIAKGLNEDGELANGNDVIHFHDNINDQLNELYGGSFQQQDLAAPTAATIIATDLKMPSSWKSSLALDAKLPGGIKGTLEGIYSYNFNEVYATQLGYFKTDSLVQVAGERDTREYWESEGIKNKNNAVMTGYYLHNEKDLHGYYYSINAQLSKDFANGFSAMAAYTHSGAKSLSDVSSNQSLFSNLTGKIRIL